MKNRIYLLWGILVIGYIPLFALGNKAQTNPNIQILQPSSEAQSLGDFAEIPVDLYTGRTNINIPLFTISYNDIEVPVSLSYHGGGIKVDDECGAVGLGWTLNAGGVVNRIVRGMPDELYVAGKVAGYDYLDQLNVFGLNQFRDFISVIENKVKGVDPAAMIWRPTAQEKELLRWMQNYGILYDEGHFDTSPDNFIFSVQGLHGAFVNNKLADKQSNTGCVVSQISNGFQITDANGSIYSFRKQEKQYYPYKVNESLWLINWEDIEQDKFLYTSAWWLTSIKSIAGDSVTFHYQTIKKHRRTFGTYAYTQLLYFDEGRHEAYDCNFISPYNHFMDTVHHQYTSLTEIKAPNSRIEFHYSVTSSHAHTACPIDSILMYATCANGEELVESYEFIYNSSGNRSQLISLIHKGRTGKTKRYDFTYYSSMKPKEDERDHWGYFLKDSRGTFPDMTYLNIVPMELPKNRVSYRHASTKYADNNMLTSITYPSGLNVQLTWEPHDFSKWSKAGEAACKEYAYTKEQQPIYDTIIRTQFELCGKQNQEDLSRELYIASNQRIGLDLSHYFYDSSVWSAMHCVLNWRQDYPTSTPPLFSIHFAGQKIFTTTLDSVNVQPNYVRNQIENIVRNNGAGYYKFQLSNPRTTLSDDDGSFCTLYNEEFNRPETMLGKIPISIYEVIARENPQNECNVGGVRIKSIEYNQGNNLLLRKEYSYIDSTGFSTGVLSYPPRYASSYPVCITTFEDGEQGGADAVLNDESYGLFLRSNGLPYALNSGGHIEYEQVTEVITSKDASGNLHAPINKTEYYYRTSATAGCSDIDETNYESLIPSDMLQLTSKQHWRGHLWKKVEYSDEHRITLYNYKVIEQPKTIYFTGALFPIADFQQFRFNLKDSAGSINAYKNFGIVRYRVIPYNKQLMSIQVIGEKTKKFDTYTYNTNDYSSALNADLPVTHTYAASDDVPLVDYIVYKDNTNKISECITKKDGYIVAGYRLEYDSLYRVTEKHLARINPNDLNDIQWDMVESYRYYQTINKIVEVINHKTNITTSYLWSYGGQYPIAEIVNATLEDVEVELTTDKILELQESYNPNMSLVNNLRDRLPNADINTMTYEPLVGITSYTDAKGYTQYYEYDDFGHVQEIYELVNGTKHILKHFDYQLKNQ